MDFIVLVFLWIFKQLDAIRVLHVAWASDESKELTVRKFFNLGNERLLNVDDLVETSVDCNLLLRHSVSIFAQNKFAFIFWCLETYRSHLEAFTHLISRF